jgi:hypothetical protein
MRLLSRRFQQVPQSARVSASLFSRDLAVAVAAQMVRQREHSSSGCPRDLKHGLNHKETRSIPREMRGFPYPHPFDSGRCHA